MSVILSASLVIIGVFAVAAMFYIDRQEGKQMVFPRFRLLALTVLEVSIICLVFSMYGGGFAFVVAAIIGMFVTSLLLLVLGIMQLRRSSQYNRKGENNGGASRVWSNIVSTVGTVVLAIGCADFLITHAYPHSNPALRTAVSMVLVIIGLITILVGFAMKKVLSDIDSKMDGLQMKLHELQKERK